MMPAIKGVSKNVSEKLDTIEKMRAHGTLDKALEDAANLSDLFSDVKPEIYVAPLDAMAGFPSSTSYIENEDNA